jgi:hypothetical protein
MTWITTSKNPPSSPNIVIEELHQENSKTVRHKTKRSKTEIEEDETIRSLKIRIVPTKEQKEKFHWYFGITRFVYNRTLDFHKGGHKPSYIPLKTMIFNPKENPDASKYPWLFDVKTGGRKDLRTEAVQDYVTSYHATKESLKAKKIPIEPDMKYKTKNSAYQSFRVCNNGGNPPVKFVPASNTLPKGGFEFGQDRSSVSLYRKGKETSKR